MIEKIAWNMFKNTGNIDTFLELKQLENIQNNKDQRMEANEYNKNERNNNCRK